MKNKHLFIQVFSIGIAILSSFYIFQNKKMSDNWVGPYLSASKNLTWSGKFLIDIDDVKKFKQLDASKQNQYHFKKSTNLIHYNHNPIGYAYLIKLSSLFFPFFGEQLAIILFQILFFIFINIIFLKTTNFNNKQKWLFFILFSINPLILKFVVFNFYYFWQIIPSVIIGYLLLSEKYNLKLIFILVLFLPFTILTRPTILIVSFIVFYLLYKKINFKITLLSFAYTFAILFWLYQPTKKNIWHTIYIGIGAYSNPYNIKLSDNSAYNLFESKTKIKINASVGGNYYEETLINKYTQITKDETKIIFKNNPFIFFKNSILNTLQGYSIGYINKSNDILNYLIAFSGLLVIAILLYYKKYIWFISIGFSIGTFTLYYPPVQGYMYGAYLLIILSIINIKPKEVE